MFRRGIGPMGRGGARRRTRRRMSMMMSAQQKAQIEKETGKSAESMTDEELEAKMKKRGMEIPKGDDEAEGEGDDGGE